MTSTESAAQAEEPGRDWAYGEGDVLENRYEIVEPIAQGAFGEVHAARDRDRDARVALKVLRTDSEQRDPKAVARMRQEAEILRALDHPNLVEVHDIVQIDGRECLVMELLDGRSLRELIDAGETATPERARKVVAQILSALEAMHNRGVQHRDLKPDNIILHDDPERPEEDVVKFVDFGIAKARDFLDQDHEQTLVETQENGFVGTPRYAAPEQAVGDPIDSTSDLFSVGLVISEWFSGEPRIDESARRGVVSILIQPSPLDVSDCPESWQSWLGTMMAKTPDDRFQSARAALDALPGFDPSQGLDVEGAASIHQRATWPESDPPETVDLDASETDSAPAVGSPGDPEEPTVVTDADDAPKAPPLSSDRPEGAPERPDRSPQRSESSDERGDLEVRDETQGTPEKSRWTSTSFWLTLASLLFFLFSVGIFIFSLLEVLS